MESESGIQLFSTKQRITNCKIREIVQLFVFEWKVLKNGTSLLGLDSEIRYCVPEQNVSDERGKLCGVRPRK